MERLLFLCALLVVGLAGAPRAAIAVTDDALVVQLLESDEEFLRDTIQRLDESAVSQLQPAADPAKPSGAPPLTKAALTKNIVSSPGDSALEAAEKRKERLSFFKSLSPAQRSIIQVAGKATLDDRRLLCADKRPAIHSIGWHPIFTFEDKATARPANAGPRSVRIPVEGYDLNPPCVSVEVQIDGTIPVSRYGSSVRSTAPNPDFYLTRPSDDFKDGLHVILLEPYLDRLKSGDKVSVTVLAANKFTKPAVAGQGPVENRRLSISRRVFLAYTAEAYRQQVLRTRIQPDDINAFPLPESEARALFGPLVSESYFVVRVSVRNTDSDAKLISSGMIRASGTAMIDPKTEGEMSFSVPVSVVPHSLQQIYTLIADEEPSQPRHRFFRGLEFVGALAAGAQGIFNYGVQAAKNVALFTGIVIPEGKKLWPDRWPGYQRNIVNYAMPDLLKVPANSVVEHKFLFFSKKELDGLVSDPNLFAPPGALTKLAGGIFDRRDAARPDAYVIALAFDSLDIRFENVFATPAFTPRDQLRDVSSQLSTITAELDLQKAWVSTTPLVFSGLTVAEMDRWKAALAKLATGASAGDDTKKTAELAKSLQAAVTGLAPGSKAGVASGALAVDLYGKTKFGLPAMAGVRERSGELVQRMNGGVDPELLRDEVSQLDASLKTSQALLSFYKSVASILKDLLPAAETIAKSIKADGTVEVKDGPPLQEFNTNVQARLDELKAKKPEVATLALL